MTGYDSPSTVVPIDFLSISSNDANNLLLKMLNAAGYHKATTTPGTKRHMLCPVLYDLIVKDFDTEYIKHKHVNW